MEENVKVFEISRYNLSDTEEIIDDWLDREGADVISISQCWLPFGDSSFMQIIIIYKSKLTTK
jgi:hypothetical protein